MLVVVNQPHTRGFVVKGDVPEWLMTCIDDNVKKEDVKVASDDGEELVNVFEEDWFKEIESQTTPGENLRFFRKLNHLTQIEVAKKLGTSKQAISAMERNERPISRTMAKKIGKLFRTYPGQFI